MSTCALLSWYLLDFTPRYLPTMYVLHLLYTTDSCTLSYLCGQVHVPLYSPRPHPPGEVYLILHVVFYR